MPDVHQISDSSHSAHPASGQWANIAADVHQDPQFNRKLADARNMSSEFNNIFGQLDKDGNEAISLTEIQVAQLDPAFAKDKPLLDFMAKDYSSIIGLGGGDNYNLGITKDDMKKIPTVLDPSASQRDAMWKGATGIFSGSILGAGAGFIGTSFATSVGTADAGFFVVPIAGASAPVLIGITAVAAVGAAGAFGYLGYESTMKQYDSDRAKFYPDIK